MSGPRRRSAFAARLSNSEPDNPDVIGDLRHAILAGSEPPGTLIPVRAVADFFGVSQIPVREALKVLTGEGLVEHVPHVGYSVAQLTFTEFRELYDVREALEAAALRQAVQHAQPADDDAVRAAHAELDASVAATAAGRERDGQTFHPGSRRLHMAFIAPARMPRLVHIYEAAWNVTEPVRPMALVDPEHRLRLHEDHGRMLEAFLRRDADLLVAESARHFENLRRSLEPLRREPVFRAESLVP